MNHDARILLLGGVTVLVLAISITWAERDNVNVSLSTSDAGTETSSESNGPDAAPPQIGIARPVNGADLADTNQIEVDVRLKDRSGINSSEIYIDHVLVKSCKNVERCTYPWDLTNLSNGPHTVRVVARDNSSATNQGETTILVTK